MAIKRPGPEGIVVKLRQVLSVIRWFETDGSLTSRSHCPSGFS